MENQKGKVLYNKQIAEDTYKMVFNTSVEKIHAGQFVSLLVQNKTLRRPFSVSDFEKGKVTILYKIKGEGTKYLTSLKENYIVDYIAPQGNSFNITNKKKVLLVGAGIGIAPMLFLKKELTNKDIENFLITGFKNEKEVIEGSDEVTIGGSVLDNIEKLIKKYKPDLICSCGPRIVLELISKIGLKNKIETQVAMEKIMACGIGVCRGCVIETKSGNKTVCKDGPVFLGSEVIW